MCAAAGGSCVSRGVRGRRKHQARGSKLPCDSDGSIRDNHARSTSECDGGTIVSLRIRFGRTVRRMIVLTTKLRRRALLWLAAGLPLLTGGYGGGQQSTNDRYRLLEIRAQGVQPAISLKVWAEGEKGLVSVRDGKGDEVQRLSCTLLRNHRNVTREEWEGVRGQFIDQFVLEDFDSDGFVDLAGVREYGAKWARYCVWLFDPKQHRFAQDFLAEQMELLLNLSKAGDGMVSSSSMGPTNPWVATFHILGANGSRPTRQLLPARSCLVETAADGNKAVAIISTRYDGSQPTTEQTSVDRMDATEAIRHCLARTR